MRYLVRKSLSNQSSMGNINKRVREKMKRPFKIKGHGFSVTSRKGFVGLS